MSPAKRHAVWVWTREDQARVLDGGFRFPSGKGNFKGFRDPLKSSETF